MTERNDLQGQPPEGDRRRSPRFSFGVVQQVAEMVDGEIPSSDAFQRVQVIDVSREGFSYYTLSAPASDQVLAIMGDPPDLSCLRARVVYCNASLQWGHEIVRVGCQFTGDAKLDANSLVISQQPDHVGALQQLEALGHLADGQTRDGQFIDAP